MIYGWWIVIAILINISLLGPAAVALANIFQTSVAGIVDLCGGYNTARIVMAILGVVGGASWLVAITNSKNYVKKSY